MSVRFSVRRLLRGAPVAVALLTRLPIPPAWHSPDVAAGAAWIPLVGAAVGGLAAAAWSISVPFGAPAAAALVLTMTVLVTGALHEDGLADTADALGGATSRERVFEILKDSRIGSYGGLAIGLSILWRSSLLVQLGPSAPGALIAAHMLGRYASLWQMAWLPYVTPAQTAHHRLPRRIPPMSVAIATVGVLAVAATCVVRRAIDLRSIAASFAITAGVVAFLGTYYRSRCGGITGDFLGATEQVTECGVLLVFSVSTHLWALPMLAR
jgi:adenosylcobinamide-GDP ribazoletransferase